MADSLPEQPRMSAAPSTFKLAPGVHAGYVIGATDRPHDTRVVARTIAAHVEYRMRDREFSDPSNLHEIAIKRRFYEEQGGSLRVEAAWVPGLKRHKDLTHAEFMAEVERLRTSYIIPRADGKFDVFSLLFGSEPAEQAKRLHKVMREQLEAWDALVKKALDALPLNTMGLDPEIRLSLAYDNITNREIEQIINLATGGGDDADDLVLPELQAPAKPISQPVPMSTAPAMIEPPPLGTALTDDSDEGDSPVEKLVNEMTAVGIPLQSSLALATQLDALGAGGTLSDDQIIAVVGSKAKLAAAKSAIAKARG